MTLKPTKISQLVLSIFFFAGLLAWFAATPTPVFAAEIETLGCSETPAEGDLCITVNDTGRFSTQRYTTGSWVLVTEIGGAALQANGVGYNLGYRNSGDATRVSNTRTADTVTTVLDAGGLVYTQAITYTTGDEWVDYHWSVANSGANSADLTFIHGHENTYISGYFSEPTWNGSDTVGKTHTIPGALFVYEFQGVTAPDAYQSGESYDLRASTESFALSRTLDYADINGYALQWNRAGLASGETWQIDARERFTLDAPRPLLQVFINGGSGDPAGTVTSIPDGIDCGYNSGEAARCIARFSNNASVELTAESAPGFSFEYWYDRRSESYSYDSTYVVSLPDDYSISAVFSPILMDVTISVVDGSAHPGLPLSGMISTVFGRNRSVIGATWYDTGRITEEVSGGIEYTLLVSSPGYITQQREVRFTPDSDSATFAMLPDPAAGCPAGYAPGTESNPITVLQDGFESGAFPPTGWIDEYTGEDEPGWETSTDAHTGSFSVSIGSDGEGLHGSLTGTTPFHIPANAEVSFYHKVSPKTDHPVIGYTELIMYLIDMETGERISQPYYIDAPETPDTWVQFSYPLHRYAGRDVVLSFEYYNVGYPEQWSIDDIQISGTLNTCDALDGGRVIGQVRDAETGEEGFIYHVQYGDVFANDYAGDHYMIWAPPGEVQLEASGYEYFPAYETVTVPLEGTIRQDFALERGYHVESTAIGSGDGAITIDKEPLYHRGEAVQFTATPDAYSTFAGWSDDQSGYINSSNALENPLTLAITSDFRLNASFTPLPVTLSVALSDGGAHPGMPTPGTVTVRVDNSSYPDETEFPVDPFTGQVELPLEQNIGYTLIASAPGYISQTRSVRYLDAAASEAFTLIPDPATGCPVGYRLLPDLGPTPVFTEGFESGSVPPPGWIQENSSWRNYVPWAASADAHSGSFSAFHDQEVNQSYSPDGLVSPLIHIPADGRLVFSQKVNLRDESLYTGRHILYLRDRFGDDIGNTQVTIAPPETANSWNEVTYDLSEYAGQDLYIVFEQWGTSTLYPEITELDDQWWLDDIHVEGSTGTCEALSGGVVRGTVRNAGSSAAMYGATVASGASSVTTGPDGAYRIWLPTGPAGLNANAPGFQSQTIQVTTVANAITHQDFSLQPLPTHTLTTHTSGSGSGTVDIDEEPPYLQGDVVHLTAHPAAGSRFSGWSGNGVDPAHTLDNPLALTITADTAITAGFDLAEYTLIVTVSGSGSVSKTPDKATYLHGDIVHLTAHPAAGSRFTGWGGDAGGTTNPITITINGDTEVTAAFTPNEYPLTITVNGPGSVSKSPNKASYHLGDVVTLSATPGAGAHFVAWSGGGLSGDTPTAQITISGDTLVYAVFAETQYSLDVLVVDGAGGTVTRDKPGPYHLNDVVRLTAAPGANYHFSAWGGDAGGSGETVAVTITGNMLVTARFDPNQADLGVSLSAAPAGAGKTGLRITLTNHGPDPASGAALTATFGSGLGEITWTCAGVGAACPNASGGGSLNETFPVLPSGATLTYTITASTPGPDGLDVSAAIIAPPGLIDPLAANNTADLLLNKTLYKVAVPLIIKR